MQGPKKTIMFDRNKFEEKAEPIKGMSKIEVLPDKVGNKDNSGARLAIWIKNAEIINKSALCKMSNIDRGNLDKYVSKGVIPDQHIKSLTNILKNYGYAD